MSLRRSAAGTFAPYLAVWAALALAGCASEEAASTADTGSGGEIQARLECVPFARALSGIALRGDAADWWDSAAGSYSRSQTPSVGAVLVFARSGRLPHGHVGVVTQVIDDRTIKLTQANWVHGEVTIDQEAIDVSDANDWQAVKVFWPPSGQMGTSVYPALGFIAADQGRAHDDLVTTVPRAIEVAQGGG